MNIQIDEIIKALNYISESTRDIKAFNFNKFISIYQRPTIMPREGVLVGQYEKWCYKKIYFVSCFGINIQLFSYWDDEAVFTEQHANDILNHIRNTLEEIKHIYF